MAKHKKSPLDLAYILKKEFLENFKEFEKIDVAKPGFLNINFKINFWKKYLLKVVETNTNYGSNRNLQQIPGNPPDLIDLPDQCPYLSRCSKATNQCRLEPRPLLREIRPGHFVACYNELQ